MEVIYGCECESQCQAHGDNNPELIPCAYIIERDGKEMKVCTRCLLTTDKRVAFLVDDTTVMTPFVDYDALGVFCLMNEYSRKEDD